MCRDAADEIDRLRAENERLRAEIKEGRDAALEEVAVFIEDAAGALCGSGMIGGAGGDKSGEAKAYAIAEVLPLIAEEIRQLKVQAPQQTVKETP